MTYKEGLALIRMVAALAQSRDGVDRAIALGDAIPRLRRLKSIITSLLVVGCFVLTVCYIHMEQEIDTLKTQHIRAHYERQQMLDLLERLGKLRASPQSQR